MERDIDCIEEKEETAYKILYVCLELSRIQGNLFQ